MGKGVKHFFKNGTEHKGSMHKMPNGTMHSGKTHGASSKPVVHFKDLSASAKKKLKHNGSSEVAKKFKVVDKTEVADQVWKTFFQDRRKISTKESNRKSNSVRVRINNKSKEEGN